MTRTRPFLESITWRHDFDPDTGVRYPVEPVGAAYVDRDTALRVAHHRPRGLGAHAVRLSRCGEPPGRWGDVVDDLDEDDLDEATFDRMMAEAEPAELVGRRR